MFPLAIITQAARVFKEVQCVCVCEISVLTQSSHRLGPTYSVNVDYVVNCSNLWGFHRQRYTALSPGEMLHHSKCNVNLSNQLFQSVSICPH